MSNEGKTGLLIKFYKHQLNDDELIQLFEWINHPEAADEIQEEMDRLWENKQQNYPVRFDQQRIFEEIKKKINGHETEKRGHDFRMERPEEKKNTLFNRKYLKYAAVILFPIAILAGSYFAFYRPSPEKISYIKTVVPKGKKEKVILADGTRVWLNSESTLRYPVKMGRKIRKVFLTGEAFFDVTKNKKKPFVVVANNFSVRVLGTAFDVNAYPDNNSIQTVLVRGKVSIHVTNDNSSGSLNAILEPGERAIYERSSNKIGVQEVDTKQFTSWMKGRLVFKKTPLTEVVKRLNRWYNVNICIHDDSIKSYLYTVSFKKETLQQALSILQKMTPIVYVKTGKGILIEQDKGRSKKLMRL